MKIRYIFCLLGAVILLTTITSKAQTMNSKDLTIAISAEITKTPTPSIKLKWDNYKNPKRYDIYKKAKSALLWGNPIATLDSNVTEWTDFSVKVGVPYEYQILGTGQKYVKSSATDSGYVDFTATGYILAGIEVLPDLSPGTCLLLVDSTMVDILTNEINTLTADLQADGWNVVEKSSPRAENFDGNKVKIVKGIIADAYKENADLSSIILIGRVPVPYSGNLNPDGHPDHLGAWPADVYYGTINESAPWTDYSVNSTTASRAENRNVPGDGKFDNTTLDDFVQVKFAVGRIDFYNMPLFYDSTKAYPEAELVRKYLVRDHLFRTNQLNVEWKGLIDDNFSAQSYPEAFAASAWRVFSNFFPADSVQNVDYVSTLSQHTYLWSYGCGGGTYTSAGGIGTSTDMQKNNIQGIFTMLFGSYFGDWDNQNNFLRSPLASTPGALTIGWSGRPHWFLHRMNLGETIGSSLLLTQNNNNLFYPNIYYTAQYPQGVLYTTGTREVHIALLGDPTLKMFNNNVATPSNLQLSEMPNGHIQLSWNAPSQTGDFLYVIYRATQANQTYQLITSSPIAETQFEDNFLYDGTLDYIVKAVEIENSRSGSFYSSSNPIFANIKTTDVPNNNNNNNNEIAIFPNPTTDYLTIQFQSYSTNSSIEILNLEGKIINSFTFNSAVNVSNNLIYNLNDYNNNKIGSGVYFVKISTGTKVILRKFIKY